MNTMSKKMSLKSAASASAMVLLCQAMAHAQTERMIAPLPGNDVGKPVAAQAAAATAGVRLLNLVAVSPTTFVDDGNKRCPKQPYYLYSGGNPDNFALPADPAYPSPNLVAIIPPPKSSIVAYDMKMIDGRFGDSFNLQNTRSVCHAVIQFRTQVDDPNNAGNDGLTMGHVTGSAWNTVAQIINPGTATHTYAFNPAGLNLLSQQTGGSGGKQPSDSVFDFYLQDDTRLDFFRMFVWYGPPCGGNPTSC